MNPSSPHPSLHAFDGAPPGREDTRARALAALGDDAQLFEMLMPHFCEAAPTQADSLVLEAQRQDAAQIRHWAHTLKGTLLTIGAAESAALAAGIEAAARQGELEGVIGLTDRLARETALLVQHLRDGD